MQYKRENYTEFSSDSQRIIANLEQAHAQWVDLSRELLALPVSMYWTAKDGREYLYAKQNSQDDGTSLGAKNEETIKRYEEFSAQKSDLKARLASLENMLSERVGLYRRLRLPSLPDKQGEILRALDVADLLGTDLMVVGTNAFVAYQLACGAMFPTGVEETEDFDLTWIRGTQASLQFSRMQPSGDETPQDQRKSLLGVLRSIDRSYRINPKKRYQAVNSDFYEVELLAAPSTHPLPKENAFEPMYSLFEQEPLLLGRPVSAVVATIKGRACPLVVPDPRFMALHKLWLADKPERKASKKEKDRRQGYVLLDAVRYFLQSSHPLNMDFVMDLPADLRPIFDLWCAQRQFIPAP
jgi:hypothetical protein